MQMYPDSMITSVFFSEVDGEYSRKIDQIKEEFGENILHNSIHGTAYVSHSFEEGYSPINATLARLAKYDEFNISKRSFFIERKGSSIFVFSIDSSSLTYKAILDDQDLGSSFISSNPFWMIDEYSEGEGAVTVYSPDFSALEDTPFWKGVQCLDLKKIEVRDFSAFTFDPEFQFLQHKDTSDGIGKIIVCVLLVMVALYVVYDLFREPPPPPAQVNVNPWQEYQQYVGELSPAPRHFLMLSRFLSSMENVSGWDYEAVAVSSNSFVASIESLGGSIDNLKPVMDSFDGVTTSYEENKFLMSGTSNFDYKSFPYEIFQFNEAEYFLVNCLKPLEVDTDDGESADVGGGVLTSLGKTNRSNFTVKRFKYAISNLILDELSLIQNCLSISPVHIQAMKLEQPNEMLSLTLEFELFGVEYEFN